MAVSDPSGKMSEFAKHPLGCTCGHAVCVLLQRRSQENVDTETFVADDPHWLGRGNPKSIERPRRGTCGS